MAKLKTMATCINGFTFREKPHNEMGGNTQIIQLGDITTNGELNFNTLITCNSQLAYNKFISQNNDIIFRGKGHCTATMITETTLPIVVASPLIIIKLESKNLLPRYLTWFLNSHEAARHFARSSQGSVIKAIGIKELQELIVPVPPLETQEKIIKLAGKLHQEITLLEKLKHSRQTLIMKSLLQTAHMQDQKEHPL
jgi:restriction endonuclease S subunit